MSVKRNANKIWWKNGIKPKPSHTMSLIPNINYNCQTWFINQLTYHVLIYLIFLITMSSDTAKPSHPPSTTFQVEMTRKVNTIKAPNSAYGQIQPPIVKPSFSFIGIRWTNRSSPAPNWKFLLKFEILIFLLAIFSHDCGRFRSFVVLKVVVWGENER